jgi:hypothetical protein
MNNKNTNLAWGWLLLVAAWLLLAPGRVAIASIDLGDPGSGTDATLAGVTNAASTGMDGNTGSATNTEPIGSVASTNATLAANTPGSHERAIILSEEENRNIASLEGLNKTADLSGVGNKAVGISPGDSLLQSNSGPKATPSATLLGSPNSIGGILYYDDPTTP